jgi:hypothetical protein
MEGSHMNISIFNYSSPESMKKLCQSLNFPPEVRDKLVYHIQNMDLAKYEPYFKGLFSLETGAESVKEIPALCKTEEDPTGDTGLKALAVYMAAAQHTHKIYTDLGISDNIYIDSMKAFCQFVKEHMQSFGHYGFDRDFWIYRQLSANLFRLGTLEYELRTLPVDAQPVGNAVGGSPILSVHIPSNAVLTRESLDASYRMAREFFAKHFPDFQYQCVYCSTWLLSPVLKQILKPDSRILEFQSDYEITHVDMESNSGIRWIFKKEYEDYSQLPEDTSLMRSMKQVLLNGGKTGSATGYVKDFGKK